MTTAIIYEGAAGTPVHGPSTTIVAAPRDQVVPTARRLVDAGARRIELCGAMWPLPWAAVRRELGGRARVGGVMYGFESLEGIAEFKRRFAAGEVLTGAFLYLESGADPAVDRHEHAGTTFVAVPDEDAVAGVVAELSDRGVALFELYGGLSAAAAAAAVDAAGGRVPVGVALYDR